MFKNSKKEILRNQISLFFFCAIDKPFGTHLEVSPKLIPTKFKETNTKDLGVIDISDRNITIHHTFKITVLANIKNANSKDVILEC